MALPSRRGWLVHELGWEAAGYGCQLEALLADPAMQAALTALPAAGRILRPLCRMLGVTGPAAAPPAILEAMVMPARVAPTAQVWPDGAEEGGHGQAGMCLMPATGK